MSDLNEGLHLNPKDPLFNLITGIPDYYDNPEGKVARDAIIGFAKISLPGQYKYFMCVDYDEGVNKEKPFCEVFYKSTCSNPPAYTNCVQEHFNVYASFFGDFSNALLCHSIGVNCDLVQIDKNKAETDVEYCNYTVRVDGLTDFYTFIIKEHYIKSVLSYNGDLNKAKTAYIDNICTQDWVNYKMFLYQNGQWEVPGSEWEEFHHWIKLKALGASDYELHSTIATLRDMGLKIWDRVQENSWKDYTAYYTSATYADIDDESKFEQTREVMKFHYFTSMGNLMCTVEGNFPEHQSIMYVQEYGTAYYIPPPPPPSCFSSNTLVLMNDGSLKPIKDVKVGDSVLTTSGSRKVALVSMPPKGNRIMYKVNGLDFSFTIRHPFVNYNSNNQPRYMAVSPLDTLHTAPTMGYDGVGRLSSGSKILGFDPNKKMAQPVVVDSVDVAHDVPGNEVYDLVLEPDASGRFEYIVGSHDALFVVASELPSFHNATLSELLAIAIIIEGISMASPILNNLYTKLGQDEYKSLITKKCQMILSSVYSKGELKKRDVLKIKTKSDMVQYLMEGIKSFNVDGSYNVPAGIAFDCLMGSLFPQVASSIDFGYRIIPKHDGVTPGPDVLSLSLNSVSIGGNISGDVMSTLSVVINTCGKSVSHKLGNGKVAGKFGGRLNQMFYIPTVPDKRAEEVSIQFQSSKMDSFEPITASFTFPFPGVNHQRLHTSKSGMMIECYIDMRCLNKQDMEKEKKASLSYTEDDSLKIANGILRNGFAEFAKLLQN